MHFSDEMQSLALKAKGQTVHPNGVYTCSNTVHEGGGSSHLFVLLSVHLS